MDPALYFGNSLAIGEHKLYASVVEFLQAILGIFCGRDWTLARTNNSIAL